MFVHAEEGPYQGDNFAHAEEGLYQGDNFDLVSDKKKA
jgi:hypothetical protein